VTFFVQAGTTSGATANVGVSGDIAVRDTGAAEIAGAAGAAASLSAEGTVSPANELPTWQERTMTATKAKLDNLRAGRPSD